MKQKNCLQEFFKYTISNVLGMIGLSCYILADTFFISKGLGANGLTALNLAIPVYSFIHGTSLMLGMGGATRYSILRGERTFSYTVYMTAFFAGMFMLLGLFGADALTTLLGADEAVYEMTRIYLKVILLFAPFFMMNDILNCFVRNDGNPKLAMTAMLLGSFSNIILDYVFIFPMQMGIFGAVLATGFAPIIGMLVLSVHFLKKKNSFSLRRVRIRAASVRRIMALGVPSMITEAASGIVIIIFNMIILKLNGNVGVAAYGVVANISLVVTSIYNGVAQGMQPLISQAYGQEKWERVHLVQKYGMWTILAVSAVIYLGIWLFAEPITAVFNSEQNAELQLLAEKGLMLYFTSAPFAGFNIILSAYFTSIDRALPAQVLSLLRGIVLVVPAAYLMSAFLGINGVWLTLTVVEGIVALLGGTVLILQRPLVVRNK